MVSYSPPFDRFFCVKNKFLQGKQFAAYLQQLFIRKKPFPKQQVNSMMHRCIPLLDSGADKRKFLFFVQRPPNLCFFTIFLGR